MHASQVVSRWGLHRTRPVRVLVRGRCCCDHIRSSEARPSTAQVVCVCMCTRTHTRPLGAGLHARIQPLWDGGLRVCLSLFLSRLLLSARSGEPSVPIPTRMKLIERSSRVIMCFVCVFSCSNQYDDAHNPFSMPCISDVCALPMAREQSKHSALCF